MDVDFISLNDRPISFRRPITFGIFVLVYQRDTSESITKFCSSVEQRRGVVMSCSGHVR